MLTRKDLVELLGDAEERHKKAHKKYVDASQEMANCLKDIEAAKHLLKTRFGNVHPPLRSPQPKRFESMSAANAAFEILKETSHPISLGEIWRLLKEGGKEIGRASVGVILSTDKRSRFKRVKPGVFALSNSHENKEEDEDIEEK